MTSPSLRNPSPQRNLLDTSPYSTFSDFAKLGYHASVAAYAYDRKLGNRHYKSNLNIRGTILTELGTLKYVKGNDSVGFWLKDDTMVIGFRGTDLSDPERYLGFIPNDYDELVNKTLQKYNTKFQFLDFNTVCPCEAPINCKAELSREMILEETNLKICNFQIPVTKFDSILNPQERLAFRYDLKGGGGRCALNSDCYADRSILLGSLNVNLFNSTESKFVFLEDPKHNEVSEWTLWELGRYKNISNVIFAGHSLGGSLAFATFLLAHKIYDVDDRPNFYFAGFNSGTLRNYDLAVFPSGDWKSRCEAHRIQKDVVSLLYGTKIPTFIYKRPDMDNSENIFNSMSTTNIHGYHTFKCNNYNIRKVENVRGPTMARQTPLRSFFKSFARGESSYI